MVDDFVEEAEEDAIKSVSDDDFALIADAINVARQVQEFIWDGCYPSLRPYNAEGWRRLFQKRVDCIAEVDLTKHGGLAALRKRLLQQAALSIKALALVNRWAKTHAVPSQLRTQPMKEQGTEMKDKLIHWRNISSCFPAICGSWSESCTYESYGAITCPECLRLREAWINKQSQEGQ